MSLYPVFQIQGHFILLQKMWPGLDCRYNKVKNSLISTTLIDVVDIMYLSTNNYTMQHFLFHPVRIPETAAGEGWHVLCIYYTLQCSAVVYGVSV